MPFFSNKKLKIQQLRVTCRSLSRRWQFLGTVNCCTRNVGSARRCKMDKIETKTLARWRCKVGRKQIDKSKERTNSEHSSPLTEGPLPKDGKIVRFEHQKGLYTEEWMKLTGRSPNTEKKVNVDVDVTGYHCFRGLYSFRPFLEFHIAYPGL